MFAAYIYHSDCIFSNGTTISFVNGCYEKLKVTQSWAHKPNLLPPEFVGTSRTCCSDTPACEFLGIASPEASFSKHAARWAQDPDQASASGYNHSLARSTISPYPFIPLSLACPLFVRI